MDCDVAVASAGADHLDAARARLDPEWRYSQEAINSRTPD